MLKINGVVMDNSNSVETIVMRGNNIYVNGKKFNMEEQVNNGSNTNLNINVIISDCTIEKLNCGDAELHMCKIKDLNCDDCKLEGKVEGYVTCDDLTVTGYIGGNVKADIVNARGNIYGNVRADIVNK